MRPDPPPAAPDPAPDPDPAQESAPPARPAGAARRASTALPEPRADERFWGDDKSEELERTDPLQSTPWAPSAID